MNVRILATCLLFASQSAAAALEPVEQVDPFISSASGRWFFFTPAASPFGLVKLAPDTTGFGGYAGGGNPTGYRYSDNTVLGFSHLHEFQLGGILLMPTTGSLVTDPGEDGQDAEGWRSRFSKATEKAKPGYYRVHLEKYAITVELTATTRVGCHRYTFPATDTARVIIDVGHPLGEAGVAGGRVLAAHVEKLDESTLRASVTLAPSYAENPVSLHTEIRFNRPCKSHGTYNDTGSFPGHTKITGPGAGFFVEFDARQNQVVEARVGLSFVSPEQARKNLQSETDGKTFDEIHVATRSEWNRLLGRVRIEDDRPEMAANRIKFYTALWHVLLGRGISSDADGAYLDTSGQLRQIPLRDGEPEFARYNTDALWGSFWNLNQVWSLLYPEHLTSFARYLLSVYEETGWLPDGMTVNQRAPGMPSNHATPLLAAAFARDPAAFSQEILWAAIWKNQIEWRQRPRHTGKESLENYSRLGYVPAEDPGYGPTAHSLEYAYEDWCAAQVARQIARESEAKLLLKRSASWRRHWDETTLSFRPRQANGDLISPFNVNSNISFAEGTALQYRWFVPHDVPALVRLFGPVNFIRELDQTLAAAKRYNFGPAETNVGGYALAYNHGNQPGLQAAWLFHFAGKPELSRHYVHAICERFYGTTPAHGYGFGQDEDQGQLGAWFVLAALGLFDVEGMVRPEGKAASIGPLFQKMTLTIPTTPADPHRMLRHGPEMRRVLLKQSGLTSEPWLDLSRLWKNQ